MNAVLDANCWAFYVDELLHESPSFGQRSFERAMTAGKILFDAGGQIQHQYVSCKKGHEGIFEQFFESATLRGRLTLVDVKSIPNLRKTLLGLGLPSGEHMYFKTAIQGKAAHIVSDDIDFFDPTKKEASQKVRAKAKENSIGKVCQFMKKQFEAEVVWVEVYGAA